MRFWILGLIFSAAIAHVNGQDIINESDLQLHEIMKGYDFIGNVPENIHWSMDGKHILFDWNPENNPGNSHYSYNLASKTTEKITPNFYTNNADYYGDKLCNIEYFSRNGTLYSYNRKSTQVTMIYKSTSVVRNIQRCKLTNTIYFQTGTDVYAYNIESKGIKLIFTFKNGDKPTKDQDHWSVQEHDLFLFQKEQKESELWNQKQDSIWNEKTPFFYYGNKSVSNISITPNGKFLTFRLDTYPKTKKTHVEHHISEDGHTYTSNARPKVSAEDPNHQLGIYNFALDTVYFVDFSVLSDIRKKPAYLAEYGDTDSLYDKDRNIIMHDIVFSNDGANNVIDVRSYDNKDRWIVSIDFSSGTVFELEHQHDEAWIGGPGISGWNMVAGTLGWLNDNETIYFQSEETGFSHLYTLNTSSHQKTALTSGKWEVHDAKLNTKGTTFFITSNKNHPGNRSFYHLRIKDKALIPILEIDGNHEVSISPDERWLAVRYSSKTLPWELYIAPNQSNASLTRITKSTSEAFNNYTWYEPDVITFKATDGEMVHARLYEPEAATKNGAAIVFVHGAGYLQNAHNWWSGYYREYMFHNLLRDNGFTIIDIDYRASKGYGRDFRTAIYRHMGGKDLSDQIDGRQWLIDSLGIYPDRIGVYGGSYGGFITLMALLTEPGTFKAGAALRSVTDWNHYNHEYTSNILNYPTTDPDAYRRSSPIYFAENLQDRLIMLHGMVDDNVQFQDVIRLSERFIELGKENWELSVYPVEAHGFTKPYSWADEYRRIYELFYEELILMGN